MHIYKIKMEGIYLIHTREMIATNKKIYKIGRSHNIISRINQYPRGSKVLFIMACNNSIECETYLINLFKTKFIQSTYYGREYFEGDKKLIITEVCNYINSIDDEDENDERISRELIEKEARDKALKDAKDAIKKEKQEEKELKEKKTKEEKAAKDKAIEEAKIEKEKIMKEEKEAKEKAKEKAIEEAKLEKEKIMKEEKEEKESKAKAKEEAKLEKERILKEQTEQKEREMKETIEKAIDKAISKTKDKDSNNAKDKVFKALTDVNDSNIDSDNNSNNGIKFTYCKTCPKCNTEFKYVSMLRTHLKRSFHCLSNDEEIKTFFNKTKSINCNKCDKHFNNIQACKRHIKETKCGKSQKFKK